jgi:hypothetical protein
VLKGLELRVPPAFLSVGLMLFPYFFPLREEKREIFVHPSLTTLSSSLAEVCFAFLVA